MHTRLGRISRTQRSWEARSQKCKNKWAPEPPKHRPRNPSSAYKASQYRQQRCPRGRGPENECQRSENARGRFVPPLSAPSPTSRAARARRMASATWPRGRPTKRDRRLQRQAARSSPWCTRSRRSHLAAERASQAAPALVTQSTTLQQETTWCGDATAATHGRLMQPAAVCEQVLHRALQLAGQQRALALRPKRRAKRRSLPRLGQDAAATVATPPRRTEPPPLQERCQALQHKGWRASSNSSRLVDLGSLLASSQHVRCGSPRATNAHTDGPAKVSPSATSKHFRCAEGRRTMRRHRAPASLSSTANRAAINCGTKSDLASRRPPARPKCDAAGAKSPNLVVRRRPKRCRDHQPRCPPLST